MDRKLLLSDEGPDGEWTPFEYCSRKECGHLLAVSQRKSNAVDQGEFLLYPES